MDILRPRTWVRYDPKNCKTCTAGCCTLPLRVDAEDLFHMGFIKMEEVNAPPRPLFERLKKQGIVKSFDSRRSLFMIRRHKNSDCIFLDEKRRCTIYERRPFVCRSYPEYSVREGFCPYKKK